MKIKFGIILCLLSGLNVMAQIDPLVDDLRRSFDSYASIESIYIHADVKISLFEKIGSWPEDEPFIAQTDRPGSVEYWARDDMFRVVATTDPALHLIEDLEVAFDGNLYQLHFLSQSLLTITADGKNNPTIITAIPTPAFLAFDFVSRNGAQCPGCRLKLADFSDPLEWSKRLPSAMRISHEDLGEGLSIHANDGSDNRYHVYLQKLDDVTTMPFVIERFVNNAFYRTTDLKQYEHFVTNQGKDVWIPQLIESNTYRVNKTDGTKTRVFSMAYSVDQIEVDRIDDASIFTIDTSSISTVWNSDRREVVKKAQPAE